MHISLYITVRKYKTITFIAVVLFHQHTFHNMPQLSFALSCNICNILFLTFAPHSPPDRRDTSITVHITVKPPPLKTLCSSSSWFQQFVCNNNSENLNKVEKLKAKII